MECQVAKMQERDNTKFCTSYFRFEYHTGKSNGLWSTRIDFDGSSPISSMQLT